MAKKVGIRLFALFLIGFPYCVKGINIRWKELPDLSVGTNRTQGISGAFAGTIDGILFVAGGANFPNTSVADGGSKVFYKSVYCLREGSQPNKGWKPCGTLPYPVGYGVSITLPNGILCIGGCNTNHKFSNVLLLKWDKQMQHSVVQPLPSLPFTFDNMTGAKVGNYIYVGGGNANGKACNFCFRLDLGNIKNGWQALASFPGAPRVQPVGVGQKMNGEDCFFLLGGYTPYSDTIQGTVNTNGYVFIPSLNRWREIKSPHLFNQDISIAGGSGMAFLNRYIICFGGVNKTIFRYGLLIDHQLMEAKAARNESEVKRLSSQQKKYLSHDVQWYQYNPDVLIYDVKLKQWECLGQTEHTARAGGALITNKKSFIIVGGELKPGIRSANVYQGHIEE
ncbi:cyclically-permuted mutarotase family protein [Microbacter margulisiae]|uniref:Sialate O-acetylesterase n=1 Tax=Microbacter margulisiae TaxID=1350067 RepID=A0A7W5H3Q7_9PORP|nr:cyclically-permuted mutarotase family protein [Microbacter margulisiae]MBB3188706.1 sialate O-acetylesterase [Microbacter margulisiae]